jgi:hypothetical protein
MHINWNNQSVQICDSMPEYTLKESIQHMYSTVLELLALARCDVAETEWKLYPESVCA